LIIPLYLERIRIIGLLKLPLAINPRDNFRNLMNKVLERTLNK